MVSGSTERRPGTQAPKGRAASSKGSQDFARFDHGLAEFPAFRFGRRRRASEDLITFTDSIKGPGNRPLHRTWTVHPSRYGYGGATTQALLFDLHECWRAQGFQGSRIYFGTLRKLYQRQHPGTPPSASDYTRLRRDLSILCGYKFDCENAFWDPVTKSYGTMRDWSLFTGWYEAYKRGASEYQEELPLGFIEVSDTFARIARERGFFVTGFDSAFFHALRPTEQRLALYLSKFFASQEYHQRTLENICGALPIEGAPKKQRQTLKKAAEGLIEKGYPNLEGFKIGQAKGTGNWLVRFKRRALVAQEKPVMAPSPASLPEDIRFLVEDIVELTKDSGSIQFYAKSIRALGAEQVRYAYADLKSEMLSRSGDAEPIKKPGAWLTKKLLEMAKERGIELRHHAGKDLHGRRETMGPRSR